MEVVGHIVALVVLVVLVVEAAARRICWVVLMVGCCGGWVIDICCNDDMHAPHVCLFLNTRHHQPHLGDRGAVGFVGARLPLPLLLLQREYCCCAIAIIIIILILGLLGPVQAVAGGDAEP